MPPLPAMIARCAEARRHRGPWLCRSLPDARPSQNRQYPPDDGRVTGTDDVKQVREAATLADAYVLRDVLQREGIPAAVRNEHLPGASGHGIREEMPAVWVADGDLKRAVFILGEYVRDNDASDALDGFDSPSSGDEQGGAAQAAMTELFLAAKRLMRQPRHGDSVEQVLHYARFVESAEPPFGVEPRTWTAIGRAGAAVVTAVMDSDEVETEEAARRLGDLLQPLV